MNEMSTAATEEKDRRPVGRKGAKDQRGSYLAWGIFLVLAGLALLAKEMGWLSLKLSWLLPAILIAIGCGYLYDAFKKKY